MFDHVTIRASDARASERFYRTLLSTLELEPSHVGDPFVEWDDFSLAPAAEDAPVTRRLHIGFAAPSHAHVDAFWRAGVDAGYRDDGTPGPRPQYRDDYYGAFLLDPDGNSVEAVHHGALRRGGNIDHLWIRVGGLRAAVAFYETIAPHAGLRVGSRLPDRTLFAGSSGSFSVVADGAPTEAVHLAFPADSPGPVDAFHAAALAAGYRDNGEPGERPQYHPGYYGAFVLDPDGNNVEVVHHDRG